jgi:hypothetical protein
VPTKPKTIRQPAERVATTLAEAAPAAETQSDHARVARILSGRAAAPKLERVLLRRIKLRLQELENLLTEVEGPDGIEYGFYRFYHESSKIDRMMGFTYLIVQELRALLPERELNLWFTTIVAEGTRCEKTSTVGDAWAAETRPVLEAFFHAHMFLKLACLCGRNLRTPPKVMPCGWAALLYLYDMR